MKTRNTFIILAAAGMVSASHAATTLIDRTFDGVNNETGPAVQGNTNGVGNGGSADFTTGVLTTGDSASQTRAFNNVSTVSLTGFTSFTATFVIDGIALSGGTQVAGGSPNGLLANGIFFGVVAGTDATSTTANYGATGSYIGYVPGSVNRGSHVVSTKITGGLPNATENDGIASTQPDNASLIDGFTVSLTFDNTDNWSISSTGLSTELSGTGSRTGLWDSMSGGVGLFAGLQGDTASQLDISRMTLTAIPEPSSALLVGLGALGFLAHRRRRP
jgi:hypothetical protein